jgi:hypothetical protein
MYLKNWLGSEPFKNNEELMEGVKIWLSSQMAEFFNIGIQKLIPRYDKFFSSAVAMLRSSLSRYVIFCI